jgi:hypothetical protein
LEPFAVVPYPPHFLLRFLAHVYLRASVELRSPRLSSLSLISIRVVHIGVLFAVLVDSLRVLLSGQGNDATHLAVMLEVPVRRELPDEVVLPQPIKVGMFDGVDSCEAVTRVHLEQLLEKVQGLWRQLA